MSSNVVLAIAFATTLLGGIAIGFMMGLTKGMALGARFRTGMPVSPFPRILCAIGSGVFFLAAMGTSIHSTYFLSNSVTTEAIVTELVESRSAEGNISHRSVYAYSTPDGRNFTDSSATNGGRNYQVGETIPVRYLKGAPNRSRIDGFSHHWLLPILMAAFSIVLCGAAVGLRWGREKEQRWANKRIAGKACPSAAPNAVT